MFERTSFSAPPASSPTAPPTTEPTVGSSNTVGGGGGGGPKGKPSVSENVGIVIGVIVVVFVAVFVAMFVIHNHNEKVKMRRGEHDEFANALFDADPAACRWRTNSGGYAQASHVSASHS